MIGAHAFVEAAQRAGFALYTGVPCSYVKPFIDFVIDAPDLRYIGAANEGDAVAIANGVALGGRRAVVMMQNSGLGNAVSPLTSLSAIFKLPALLVVTLRGEPGGPADEPQHELMGAITTPLLDLMGVAWSWFPRDVGAIDAALDRAVTHMARTGLPYALVMKKDSVAPYTRRAAPPSSAPELAPPGAPLPEAGQARPPRPSREEALLAILRGTDARDVVIATTGYTGRELCACEDRDHHLYVVGSMGCASSVGLGLAYARPDKRIVVIDGDGAVLMRMGALATIAHERPPNLIHIVLDNEAHESTGGQATTTRRADLAAVARACGYPEVARLGRSRDLETELIDRRPGLRFLFAKIRPGVRSDLPRPTTPPAAVAERLRRVLGSRP